MWRIFKAELSDEKIKIFMIFAFCVVCFIVIWNGVKWHHNRAPLTMLIMLVSTLMLAYTGDKKRTEQKRDRLHILLPVTLRQIGYTHLFYPISIWFSIAMLFFASYLIAKLISGDWQISPSILQLLTINGLIMIVNAVYLLHRDSKGALTQKMQRFVLFMFWLIVYISAILPFYIVTNFFGLFGEGTELQIFLNKLSASPIGFNSLGILLSAVSLIFFIRKQSYVVV